ncbi:MAG: phage virion morphogenesis protein [Sulfurovum sp.]|nr:phage virion morphogenesis protein [Sulfurovum sp.]
MSIEITGLEEVQAQLTNLSRSLTPSAMGRKMHTIGNKVSNVIEDAFEDERSPFGQSWQPRKRTRRGQSTKVLRKSGDLSDRWLVHATPNQVEVSNNIAWYGIIHQEGTSSAGRRRNAVIPARPFLPIDQSGRLEPTLLREIKEYLDEEIEGVLR